MVWNLVFISPGAQVSCRYVIPMATGHIVQSSLKVQDGVSLSFQMESAQPVSFLPHPLLYALNFQYEHHSLGFTAF